MKLIDPSFEFIYEPTPEELKRIIAAAADNCYRAELNAMPKTPTEKTIMIIKRGHLSVIEHVSASVNIVCDRGVTHELVRHRLCSFSQESTRYCNYSGEKFDRELTFVIPSWIQRNEHGEFNGGSIKGAEWFAQMKLAEYSYMRMLDHGATPQEARSVLPNSLAAKIAVTANMREWDHIFRLRCDKPAHPDMRQTMLPIFSAFLDRYPEIYMPTKNWLLDRGVEL